LAKIMRRLELQNDEARRLPDNFQAAVASKEFAAGYDPTSPEAGWLPPDLFDETGPWVAIGRGAKGLGAQQHASAARNRSIFVSYIRVSANRQETLRFLARYLQARGDVVVPEGTFLALTRRTAIPTSDGKIAVTPLLESLELVVRAPRKDNRIKFKLDRGKLLAGAPGLRMLTKDDDVDPFSSEAIRSEERVRYDADGEKLVLGRYVGRPNLEASLHNCVSCHGQHSFHLFANSSIPAIPMATTWAAQTQTILEQKENSPDWKLYQTLRH
jgi:hypothetical protein